MQPDYSRVTRFEVIARGGRILHAHGTGVELQLQDDAQTLKVFLTDTSAPTKADPGSWAPIKKDQANAADHLAAVASGIGEYGIANACYRLAAILRQHAQGDYSATAEHMRRWADGEETHRDEPEET